MTTFYNFRGEPVADDDYSSYQSDRRLRVTRLSSTEGHVLVSTVFLGIDHSFGDGPPVLWETMAFNQSGEGETDWDGESQRRYTSAREAVDVHNQIVAAAVAIGATVLTDLDNPDLYDF